MSANDWKCEITRMLTHVEDRVTSALSKINRSGRSVDDEFLAYFFETLNERVKAIKARVITEFKMEKTLGENSTRTTSSTFRATASTQATHVKSEWGNQIHNLIKIKEEAASECTFIESIPKTTAQSSSFGRVLLIINSDDEEAVVKIPKIEPTKDTASRSVSTSSEIIAQQCINCKVTNIVRKSSSIDVGGQDEMTINKNGKRSRSNAFMGGSCSADNGQQVKKKKIGVKTTNNNESASAQKKTKRFKCTICEYSGNHKGHLNQHMKTHTGEKPYPCDRCGKRFTKIHDLKRHAVTHTDEFPFNCQGCLRGFLHKVEKEAHDKVCLARRYECHLCRKYVTRGKTQMKAHMGKHTGEKPFRCEICMRHFTLKSDLKRHLNNIHTRINQ